MMFLPAFERARQLDKQLEETGKVQGPLHGVPVSLKDQFEIQGEDATIGFTQSVLCARLCWSPVAHL